MTEKFKKVADIQNDIENQMENYRRTHSLTNFHFDKFTFTPKQAVFNVRTTTKREFSVHTLTFKASLHKKTYSELFISCYLSAEPQFHQYEKIEPAALAEVLGIFCTYWINYAHFKGIPNVYIKGHSYLRLPEYKESLFDEVMKSIRYRKVKHSTQVLNEEYYCLDEPNTYLNAAEFIAGEILTAQRINPSFIVHKNNEGTFLPFRRVYFYQNETFSIEPTEDYSQLQLIRKGKETDLFDIKEGVMEEILAHITEDMKLLNLLKPPTMELKKFSKHFEAVKQHKDDYFEDLVRDLDGQVGLGVTENELGVINQMISDVPYEFDKTLRREKPKIDSFEYKEAKTLERFKENYDKEFTLYRFQTDKFFWYVMVSKKEKNIWLYPQKEDVLPSELLEDAEQVFHRRRNVLVMKEIKELIDRIAVLENTAFVTGTTTIKMSKDYLIRKASEEFGLKWRNFLE